MKLLNDETLNRLHPIKYSQRNEPKRKLLIPQSNLESRYVPQGNYPQTTSGLPVRVGTGWRGCGTATTWRLWSVVHRVALDGAEALVTLLLVVAADLDCSGVGRSGLVIVLRACPSRVREIRADEIVQVDRHRERGRPALTPLLGADAARRAVLVLARRRVPRAVGHTATVNGDVHAGCAGAHHPWTPRRALPDCPRDATWCTRR